MDAHGCDAENVELYSTAGYTKNKMYGTINNKGDEKWNYQQANCDKVIDIIEMRLKILFRLVLHFETCFQQYISNRFFE